MKTTLLVLSALAALQSVTTFASDGSYHCLVTSNAPGVGVCGEFDVSLDDVSSEGLKVFKNFEKCPDIGILFNRGNSIIAPSHNGIDITFGRVSPGDGSSFATNQFTEMELDYDVPHRIQLTYGYVSTTGVLGQIKYSSWVQATCNLN